MDKHEQIRQRLKDIAETFGPAPSILGTVVSVEGITCTISVDELDIPDIRLRPVIDDNEGVTIYPKVGAWLLAIRLEQTDEWMMIAAGEVDKYRLVVGDMIFESGDGKFLFKNGEDNLKDVLTLIVKAVQQIVVIYGNNPAYDKLTQALEKINNIFQ